MNEEEAVKIFDLVVKGKMLPATLDKLVPLSFIGSAAVSFYKAKVKLMDQLGMTEDQRKATLGDGQDAGRMLLDIEARIGELWEKLPEAPRPGRPGPGTQGSGLTKKDVAPQSDRVAAERMRQSALVKANPDAVAAVIAEAEENEDIPTKTAVLNRIAYQKEKDRREKAEAKRTEPERAIVSLEEMEYLNAMERVVSILPQKPPKNWTEGSLARAKSYAKIITKRLEMFA